MEVAKIGSRSEEASKEGGAGTNGRRKHGGKTGSVRRRARKKNGGSEKHGVKRIEQITPETEKLAERREGGEKDVIAVRRSKKNKKS